MIRHALPYRRRQGRATADIEGANTTLRICEADFGSAIIDAQWTAATCIFKQL